MAVKGTDLMQALGGVPEEYIARALEDAPPQKRTAFLVSKPFLASVSTAACLLLIVGVGVGVWSRQQRIDSLPPQETQTATVTQTTSVTENRTETTAQFTTASQTASRPTETTVRSTTISSRVQPPVSEAALLTSVRGQGSTVVTTAAKQTTAAEVTPGAPSDVTHTALPQTSLTAIIQRPGTIVPTAPSTSKPAADPTAELETFPATDPTAIPETELPETVPPTGPEECTTGVDTPATKPVETESTLISPTNVSTEPVETTQASDAPKPDENYDLLPGFRVVNKGELTTIYCLDPVPAPPPELYYYSLDSERFSIQSVSSKSDYRAQYEIYEAATRSQLQLTQTRRSSFISSFYRNGKLEPQTVGDYSGYWIFDNRGTRLVWDDGKYTFELFGANDDKDLFMPIAEALHITDAVI
jgi:hypothetical protein